MSGIVTPASPVRYHYMDNLRALAMMAGIFFHAALAYSPMTQNLWLGANPDTSVALDAVAWFSHNFRMPLFFLIAGFFSAYLIEKRGLTGFLKNRAKRIALPFVIFWPLVVASFIGLIVWGLAAIDDPSPMLRAIEAMMNDPDAPRAPLSTTHLWFLYLLLQLYVMHALLARFGVLGMTWLRVFRHPAFLTLVLPLIMAPALGSQIIPHPAPEQFFPRPWALVFYGLFFLTGHQLFGHTGVIDRFRPWALWMLIGSVAIWYLIYPFVPQSLSLEDAYAIQRGVPLDGTRLLAGLGEAVIAVHMTLVCLVMGKQLLDKPSRVNRLIADSSYWVYIVHLPILLWIQIALRDVDFGIAAEYLISSFGTLIVGLATYLLFVRHTPIGWLLNGRKAKPARPWNTSEISQ